jgi:peptide/nickel transport system permease protein
MAVQYMLWLGRTLRGDLGNFVRTHEPVVEALRNCFPITPQLTYMAMAVALLVALPVGIISAVQPHSRLDAIGT